MHAKAEPANRGGRAATKEQLRIAQVTQDGQDEDRSRIQKMIKEIIEMTRCSQSQAEIALHDASNNVELAVNNILENSDLDTWSHYKRKGPKGKEEEREEPVKKAGNRPARRGQQNADSQQKRGPRTKENGHESRENRQTRDKDDGNARNIRGQPARNRRDNVPNKRDTTKANVDEAVENKEVEDQWKTGPLVFNRRDNTEDKVVHHQQQQSGEPLKSISQPSAAGPLSFADVVRKSAQKAQPPVTTQADQASSDQLRVTNEAKRTTPSPHGLTNADALNAIENVDVSMPETSKSPRQPMHNLEPSAKLLHDESAAFNSQSSPQKLQQSLTDQLKNDLGLGISQNAMTYSISPQKKYQESQSRVPVIKSGVVEFVSGEVPVSSAGEWQFGFDASSSTAQAPAPPAPIEEQQQQQQFHREPMHKLPEPQRNENNYGGSALNEINASRGNASTVLNQYVQQSTQAPLPYAHQQQQFNRNRNAANPLPFSDNYSSNFTPDLRSYGAPSSPPKSQNVQQQPLQNLASQQQLPSQTQQPPHHHQQHMFPPTQLPYGNYPYVNMYSPVAHAGLRDDFAPILPYQLGMNQLDLNALSLLPHLAAVTSAGPLPTHQAQHHQNSHPQQQQQSAQPSMQQQQQHSQSAHSQPQQQQTHQRSEHYSDMSKFMSNQMNIPPGSQQNNGANSLGSQQNSNLGNARQQLMDNGSQNSITGNVPPPPGFGAAPFMPQRNLSSMFQAPYQVPTFTPQFPYVMPNAQHKSK